MSPRRVHGVHAVAGLALGFGLSQMGFSDYTEVNRMFTLTDLRLFFTFVGALAIGLGALGVFTRLRGGASQPLHPGVLPGSLLFGVGWALSGACPGIALVQLGEGRLSGVLAVAGVLSGTWLYGQVHARFFRWDSGSCSG